MSLLTKHFIYTMFYIHDCQKNILYIHGYIFHCYLQNIDNKQILEYNFYYLHFKISYKNSL